MIEGFGRRFLRWAFTPATPPDQGVNAMREFAGTVNGSNQDGHASEDGTQLKIGEGDAKPTEGLMAEFETVNKEDE